MMPTPPTTFIAGREAKKKANPPQLNGVFVLRKPAGPTSAHCIAKIKRLGQKKIGHAGTLDPMAEGVLLALLGQATKLSGYLLEGGMKIYAGALRLGVETDTWDAEGEIVAEKPWNDISADMLEKEIENWKNLRSQLVPPYSAAKHRGKPLYSLARKGLETPEKTKSVQIFESGLLSFEPPYARFRVACGSGVYIRSLAHSLGKRLGCGAALFELTREYSHPFNLDQATGLSDVLAEPDLLKTRLRPLRQALPDWPEIPLSKEDSAKVRNGVAIAAPQNWDGPEQVFLSAGGSPLALARLSETGGRKCWIIMRGLWD